MKSIPFLLMMLLIMGCSTDWGSNSIDQEYDNSIAVQSQIGDASEVRVTEIEPSIPLCESQQFGFVTLMNQTRAAVRCEVGEEFNVTVHPGRATYLRLPIGMYGITWWPTEQSYYVSNATVNTCKTTVTSFDPLHACKFSSAN